MPRKPWAPALANIDRSTMPAASHSSLCGASSVAMKRRTESRNRSCSSSNSVRRMADCTQPGPDRRDSDQISTSGSIGQRARRRSHALWVRASHRLASSSGSLAAVNRVRVQPVGTRRAQPAQDRQGASPPPAESPAAAPQARWRSSDHPWRRPGGRRAVSHPTSATKTASGAESSAAKAASRPHERRGAERRGTAPPGRRVGTTMHRGATTQSRVA